jgi:hypothetical protein
MDRFLLDAEKSKANRFEPDSGASETDEFPQICKSHWTPPFRSIFLLPEVKPPAGHYFIRRLGSHVASCGNRNNRAPHATRLSKKG